MLSSFPTRQRVCGEPIAWTVVIGLMLAGLFGVGPALSESSARHAGSHDGIGVITADEVYRGQKGYGYSVFAGTEPERFEVEVIGVMRRSASPELDYILVRLAGHDLERIGVVAGMSGSPIYLDDRLAGAVSFGYSYGMDPISGIMPIEAMRRLSPLASPAEPGAESRGTVRSSVTLKQVLAGEIPLELLDDALALLRPQAPQGARSAAMWSASGFGDDATQRLQQAVGPLAPMGDLRSPASREDGGAPVDGGELVPGAAVAGVLVQGDLNLAVHGTVTDRQGDEILAFGHPVFGSGPALLPMAQGEVLTIIGNLANSFKVSNAGQIVGAFDQDRQAGMRGYLGREAPMFPMTVRLSGMIDRDYQMRVAAIPDLAPSLVAIGALGAFNAATYSAGAQGVDLKLRVGLRGHEDVVLQQTFDGDQAVLESVVYVLGVIQFLTLNELERAPIESLEIDYGQSAEPRTTTLVSAYPAKHRVRPGESLPITLELQPRLGERYRKVVEYRIPDDAADGRLSVFLGDGPSMDATRLLVEQRSPETFVQVLDLMRSYSSNRKLLMFSLRPGAGLAYSGEVLPDLPPSILSVLGTGKRDAVPLRLRLFGEDELDLDFALNGLERLDLEVDREF